MRLVSQYLAITLLIPIVMSCSQQNNHAGELNNDASLPQKLQFDKLGLKVITSMINKKEATMSTLYGNTAALNYAKASGDHPVGDMVFAMVTWKQQNDERWFGAKIPGLFYSMEMVTSKTNGNDIQTFYKIYRGKEEKGEWQKDQLIEKARIKYILAQTASVMP